MYAWIEYGDYNASRIGQTHPGHSDQPASAIKRFGRRAVSPLTKTFMRLAVTTRRSVARQLANIRNVLSPFSPKPAGSTAQPKAFAGETVHPCGPSIHPSLAGAEELQLQSLANGVDSREPRGRHYVKQHQGPRVPEGKFEDNVQPQPRLESTSRLVDEVQAAAHLGLDLSTFRAWVAAGRLPRALLDCGKYDVKAIHLAVDRMSGINSSDGRLWSQE
jgi:hypothetical protein